MTFIKALEQFISPERKLIRREVWKPQEWLLASSYKIYHLTLQDLRADDWEVKERFNHFEEKIK